MIIRSKAPLRIGLAGGGTDVSPYADLHGGAILNATINLFARATIEPLDSGIVFDARDQSEFIELDSQPELELDGRLDLLKGVYNRVVKEFTKEPLSFRLTTYVDAPPGSGLGSSSTLVVAVLGAFTEWLKLPLGEYDIAHLAYEIERQDLELAGGRQDQYAATFGGVNFMEFYKDDKVIVNPLRIRRKIIHELQNNLVLFYTGTSRESAKIIEQQTSNVRSGSNSAIEAMHQVKRAAVRMKEALLRGQLDELGEILDQSWEYKKQMASGISNPRIEEIYQTAINAGATGGKISGAGGGGFVFFYCPLNSRFDVIKALERIDVRYEHFEFTQTGLYSYNFQEGGS